MARTRSAGHREALMQRPATATASGLPESYREVGFAWADANAAANLLEDSKSAVLSSMVIDIRKADDCSVAAAETKAKASLAWRNYLDDVHDARQKANRLSVEREYWKMKFSEWISNSADDRARAALDQI